MKRYLTLTLVAIYATQSFCAEYDPFINRKLLSSCAPILPEDLVLPRITNDNPSPEDLVQNYLYHLDHTFKVGRRIPSFISVSISYAKGSSNHINLPVRGRKGLRYLFVTPTDKKRMEDLEKRLNCWIGLMSCRYDQYSYQKKLLQSLNEFLNNKQKVTEELRISHPQLFPTDQPVDDCADNGVCVIL